ncbi:MAG: lysozyme inhibitor LprI family protein [Shinella sp.]|nr:lysozyme inhibitor LprI family protein [Shinella sp.]
MAGAYADDACYDKAQSQYEMTECSINDLKPVDDELNKLYKEMETRLKDDDDTKKALVDAQKKWVAFRDAECTLSTIRTAGGSINPMNFNICLQGLTADRVKNFQAYLSCSKDSGADQDDDCVIPAAN